MVSILLEYSLDTKQAALQAGFREKTILVRFDSVTSNQENKKRLESECRKLQSFQFLVDDFWGAAPD